MANVKIPYQPELTAAQAMTIFAERFRGKYQVSKTRQRKRDFAVKKNWSTAASVGLRQEPGTTKFIVTGCHASVVLGVVEFLAGVVLVEAIAIGLFGVVLVGGILFWVVGGCLSFTVDWILFRSGRKALESEVVAFVENAGDLWTQGSPSLPSPGAVMPSAPVGVQPAFCTSCGAPLAGQARFCQVCGAPVPVAEPEAVHARPSQLYCPRCGTQVPQSSLFCHKCGAEVASAKRGNVQIIGAASSRAPEAAIRRGSCEVCGQELGVKEKMRGLAVHERCAMPASEAPAATPATDAVGGDRSAATAPAAPDASVGGSSPTRGHCQRCGQEIGVDEKMRGLTVHKRCAMPASEAPAATPVTDAAGASDSGANALTGPDVAVCDLSPRRKYCDVCGQELGVNEKLRGLTVHQSCPTPAVEAPAAAPAQAGQVHCTECGTFMLASSRFCHKCGSAVAAAE